MVSPLLELANLKEIFAGHRQLELLYSSTRSSYRRKPRLSCCSRHPARAALCRPAQRACSCARSPNKNRARFNPLVRSLARIYSPRSSLWLSSGVGLGLSSSRSVSLHRKERVHAPMQLDSLAKPASVTRVSGLGDAPLQLATRVADSPVRREQKQRARRRGGRLRKCLRRRDREWRGSFFPTFRRTRRAWDYNPVGTCSTNSLAS